MNGKEECFMDDGVSPSWGIVILLVLVFIALFVIAILLRKLLGTMGVTFHGNTDDVTEEEIISMVKEGHEQGVLLASEAEMIHNIFEFGDKDAKDIMTHRKNIVAINGDMTFLEMLSFIKENNYSRFPVYQEDINNIIGVLHIREALMFCGDDSVSNTPVRNMEGLVREVEFIPETRNINTLFTMMQSEKNHMVVVVDEYGQTAGIVAMEDILEEIVGNIEDEHDEEEQMILSYPNGTYQIDGMADFSKVMKVLGIKSAKDDADEFETLNGFIISRIDKIPEDHEVFSVQAYGFLFEIISVENKMIHSVKVRKCTPEEMEEQKERTEERHSHAYSA